MKKKKINTYLYTRYERFWHWVQMVLIFILLLTGFEIHNEYHLFGFGKAVNIHSWVGLGWLIAFFFFIFWLLTTREWKQYIPTTKKILEVMWYYVHGIFKGETHPVPKKKHAKHNPLQRIIYLVLAALLLPVQMLTGFLYWGYNNWADWGIDFLSLGVMAFLHVAGAFAILSFVIIHVYMTTTGHSLFAHIKAMISGWEELEEAEVEEWERAN